MIKKIERIFEMWSIKELDCKKKKKEKKIILLNL